MAERAVAAAPARFGRGVWGGATCRGAALAHVRREVRECVGDAPAARRKGVAADHRILVWQCIARRCWRHVLATCARAGPLVPIGAWCAGVCWGECGLMCGTLSGRAGGAAALAARRSRAPPPARSSARAAAHPRARRWPAPRVAAQECAVSWRAVCDLGTQRCGPKGDLKRNVVKKDYASQTAPSKHPL